MAISKFRHLQPKGSVQQVNGKSDKKCMFWAKFALRKEIWLDNFSHFYICLNLARDVLNLKKLEGVTKYWAFKEKMQNKPKNIFCTVARSCFTKVQQCNSVSVIILCDRCAHMCTKMLPTQVLALCTQCRPIDWHTLQTAQTQEVDAQTTLKVFVPIHSLIPQLFSNINYGDFDTKSWVIFRRLYVWNVIKCAKSVLFRRKPLVNEKTWFP